MTSGLWSLIAMTDIMSKGVLILLLCISIACWAFAFYKRMEMKAHLKSLKQAKNLLSNVKGMDDLLARVSVIQSTYAGALITTFLSDFKRLLRAREGGVVDDKEWYLLQSTIQQRIDEALAQEELYVPVLSTAAAGSPLLGLFGTVWGLIHAFMAIAEQRTADIAAVAPGIAEALLTTLAGLLVAIPALVLFVYVQSYIRLLEQEIVDLSDTCLWIMRGIIRSDDFMASSLSEVSPIPVQEQELV